MKHCLFFFFFFFPQIIVYYKSKSGLPMCLPLSGVLKSLSLEFLESEPFKFIIPENSISLEYIHKIMTSQKLWID